MPCAIAWAAARAGVADVMFEPDLDDDAKRGFFVDGPARFYRIDLDEVLAHLGPGWDRALPIGEVGPMLAAAG